MDENHAPEWKPGMDEVTGMAAHPSMQRNTSLDLWVKLRDTDNLLTEAQDFEQGQAQREYVKYLNQRRQALCLALEWRGETS